MALEVGLDELISFLKSRKAAAKKTKKKAIERIEEATKSLEEELAATKTREALYKKLIERYAEIIGLEEEKTIPELRALVNENDSAVQETKQELFKQLAGGNHGWTYSFEQDFPKYAEKAFEKTASLKAIHAQIPVSYWLSVREILELGAADAFDKAIFLCSLLHAGGSKGAKVLVVEVEGGVKHAVVVFEFQEKVYLFDASAGVELSAGSVEELLAQYRHGEKRVTRALYEFNDAEYNEFGEE